MRFQPKTEEEVMAAGVLEGICDFEIRSAKEYTNDKGSDVFELDLLVYDTDGTPRPRKDWVTPSFAKKFKHLHDACGLIDKYSAGSTSADDFKGRSGKVKMKHRKYTDKEGVEKVGDEVEDYIKREQSPTKESITTGAMPIDDEIPF